MLLGHVDLIEKLLNYAPLEKWKYFDKPKDYADQETKFSQLQSILFFFYTFEEYRIRFVICVCLNCGDSVRRLNADDVNDQNNLPFYVLRLYMYLK